MQINQNASKEEKQFLKLHIDEPGFDLAKASDYARTMAREISKNAMMLSWYNKMTDECFPNFDCGASSKPPWQVFADARGGNLTVDINDGDYIFVFLKL